MSVSHQNWWKPSLEQYTQVGDVVFDPFARFGTALIGADTRPLHEPDIPRIDFSVSGKDCRRVPAQQDTTMGSNHAQLVVWLRGHRRYRGASVEV